MPFLFIKCQTDKRTGAILSVFATRWQRGRNDSPCFVSRIPTNINPSNSNHTETWYLPLLRAAEGCFIAGPTDSGEIDALQTMCEDDGYHLPVSDALLDITQIEHILGINTDTLQADISSQSSRTSDELSDTAKETIVPEDQQENRARANRLTTLFERACELPYVTLQHLTALAGTVSPALAQWFQEAGEERFTREGHALPDDMEVINHLAFSRPDGFPAQSAAPDSDEDECEEGKRDLDKTDLTLDRNEFSKQDGIRLLDSGSPLQTRLPGFQVRPGQLQMVESVAKALEEGHHLMVEAGTGTGKSLAYLIPAVLHAKAFDERVIVSTHTISLQDQISHRDFPILQSALGEDASLAVFKGRTHYVCMRKLHQELQAQSLVTPPEETLAYMRLLVWLTNTPEGSREELTGQGPVSSVWPRIQSETETCIHKRCPFFKPCYYFRARAKAYEADVVVTNHSLVFTDLKADHRVLPRYERLIFDEAHHVEEEATKHLGEEVHRFQLLGLIGRITRDGGKHGVIGDLLARLSGSMTVSVRIVPALEQLVEELGEIRSLCEQVFAGLVQLVPKGQSDFRIRPETKDVPQFASVREIADELDSRLTVIRKIAEDVGEKAEHETDEELAGRILDAVGFLQELSGKAALLASVGDAPENWVEWVEVSGPMDRRQVGLLRAPIDVSKILRERLFEPKESVVLTSATLSVGGDFGYMARRLGLTSGIQNPRKDRDNQKDDNTQDKDASFKVEELTVPSPFDYSRQALLCVPNDVPDMSRMKAEEAAVWLSDSIYQLARITGGRLLALFTSHAMLRATADYIRHPLAKQGIEVLAQGIDGNRTHVLRLFQERPKSVLLGAQSFWEGIDLPGDQLTTLVIVRLPFSPPTHPVTEARNERIEQSGLSAFWHQSLPDAVVRFRQGFGRLVRTVNDRGVVVVFDKRIVTARYGTQFMKSVPGLETFVGTERDVLRKVKTFFS